MENVTKIDFVESIKARTKQFVLDSIKFYQALPKTEEGKICRSRSRAEFFSKLSIVVEEADETAFWIEILTESKITNSMEAQPLLKEVNEILAIVAKARKTVSNNK